MAFKVQVGPPHIAIHQGQTVLVTEPDGTVTTYQFARTLPGPPVRMEVRSGDVVAFSMELVSRTGL